MRVTVAAIGRARTGVFRDLYEHYAGRLAWPVALREIDVRDAAPTAKAEEGRRLLAAVPDGARVIALDETGRTLSSRELADWIGRAMDDGNRDLCLLIGGADGLDAPVIQRADLVLSLGRVTWPHLLVRGMLAEQLYRAQQILAGHPYHRD